MKPNSKQIAIVAVLIGVGIWMSSEQNSRKNIDAAKAQAEEFADAIKSRHVLIGMSSEQCRAAWGNPDHINTTISRNNVTHEQWVYPSGNCLYLEDGVLTSIQKFGRR